MCLTKYFIFWILTVMVSNITNKLQKYKFFSHTTAYEHATFLTWKSVSMEHFYLNISFYFFPFQIKYLFFRLEYKRGPLPNPTGRLSSIVYSIHVPASWGFAFLITRHHVSKENGFFVMHVFLPCIKSKYNFYSPLLKCHILYTRML